METKIRQEGRHAMHIPQQYSNNNSGPQAKSSTGCQTKTGGTQRQTMIDYNQPIS
jgi:hypothetical protein